MKHLKELSSMCIVDGPVVFALGTFDGVHRGHQYLLSQGRQIANQRQAVFVVLMFSVSLHQCLHPDDSPSLLTLPCHKSKLLEKAGVDILIEIPFSSSFKNISAENFLYLLERMMHIDTWVAGNDLQFGCHREGTVSFLKHHAHTVGMKTFFLDRITEQGEPISSSRIRTLVRLAKLREAQLLLGRPYSIVAPFSVNPSCKNCVQSVEVHLHTSDLCLPPVGVYKAKVVQGDIASFRDAILQIYPNQRCSNLYEVGIGANTFSLVEPLEVILEC